MPGLNLLDLLLDKLSEAPKDKRGRVARAAPAALLLATGAGAAVWWWTQWARGRAESEAAERAAHPERQAPPDDEWTSPEG